jgi:hypothetical protein
MASPNVRPNPWLWTIAALAGLTWGVIAVIFASVGPGEYVPRVFHNYHAEHFIAFYALTLLASAGLSRAPLLHLCSSLALMALVLAIVRLFIPRHQLADAEDLAADLGGIAAAVAPILVGRFRQIVAQAAAESSE